ncbi:hypothetical protein M406DRAFT_330156 [Cryphonectria parasitica EP155]|uniref:Sfi1 spindle body domain-containing protein n=1 Tax=Cryphonectria parasitica (strain ATCC 38755 / EP155) TaxID=660469 RepID=A0A9P5CQQ6_CRYP1|nr:uncharacterized protein M406DRAFT_330156 [Cryphonectria parasitica EP155]KAF3766325.1 hypothetical protein M406DRAFT_330156 [Cryphonectria parasitica EP155]
MQPIPASAITGGVFSPAATPSYETGESNTFTDSAEEPQVRESDNTSVAVKPGPLTPDDPLHLMQGASEPTPLPNGDGGGDSAAAPTPSRERQEPWYSNEDITLLHEIIATGEAILASLPERERLPTTALFTAADDVLPRHGFASEDVPHIARLLFRIGGQRGPESLLDKFRSVLGEMGIELVYTDDSMMSADDEDDMPPAGDASTLDAQVPGVPSAPRDDFDRAPPVAQEGSSSPPMPVHHAPRRRRNSDSIVQGLGTGGSDALHGDGGPIQPVQRATRSHSTDGRVLSEPQRKEVRFSDVIDSQSVSDVSWDRDDTGASTFDNIPFRPRPDALDHSGRGGPNGSAQAGAGAGAQQDDDGRPSTRAENRPPLDFSRFGRSDQGFKHHQTGLPNGDILSDEEFSSVDLDLGGLGADEAAEEPSLPRHPIQPAERHGVEEDQEDTSEHHDLRHDEYSSQLPIRDAQDEERMEDEQVAFIASREQMFRMSSFNHWRDVSRYTRSYNIRAEAHSERWDAWETMGAALSTWIESALTMQVGENDGIQAYQDHLRQRELERNRGGTDDAPPLVLSEGSVNPRVRQSIERSREPFVSSSAGRQAPDPRSTGGWARQQSQSVDRTLIEEYPHRPSSRRGFRDPQLRRLRAFGSDWDAGVAPTHGEEEQQEQEQEQEYNDELYDASEELETQDLERSEAALHSQYQVAAAAWNYFLLSKAFTHWADRADEEVERTQIARRHILRKKCFHAWVRDRDETEAESKAVWFYQMVVMRQWREAAVDAAKRSSLLRQAAHRKKRRSLAENVFVDWYHESKMRIAEKMDAQRLAATTFQHWQLESQWLSSAHGEAEGIFKASMLGRYMRRWRGEAQIQERAEAGAGPIIARRDELLRSGLSLAWRQEAEEARNRERVAVTQELKDWTKHWVYETRLVRWQEEQDAEALDSVAYHWYCEWRLRLVERVIEQQEKTRFFERWADATTASAARSYHLRHLARDVHHHDTITGFLNTTLDALEHLEMQAYHARAVLVQRTVPRAVRKWTTQLSHHHRMEKWCRLANLFPVGEYVLPHWQEVRRQAWKRRMQRLYNDFKYRVRRDAVRDSLDVWRQATADAVTKGWEADDMCIEDDNATIIHVAIMWRARLEPIAFTAEVAEDADVEAHLLQWHSLLEVHEDNKLDAAELDFAQTAGARWDEWTLASVALRGREQTVHEFTSHNTRRDMRHFLAAWASQTQAVGDRVPEMDFRATRRSSRWGTPAPARTRLMTDMTPFRTPAKPTFGRSTTTPAYRPPSELTFEERDEDDLLA